MMTDRPSLLARFAFPRMAARAALALVLGSMMPVLVQAPAFAGETAQRKISGAESYLPVAGVRATLSNRLKAVGVMNIEAGLDIQDEKVRTNAKGRMPRVKDAMRAELASYCSVYYRIGEVPDTDQIQKRLQRAIDGLLGPGNAVVLLNAVIVYKTS
jgi:flagellar basal body-associated protein FliL